MSRREFHVAKVFRTKSWRIFLSKFVCDLYGCDSWSWFAPLSLWRGKRNMTEDRQTNMQNYWRLLDRTFAFTRPPNQYRRPTCLRPLMDLIAHIFKINRRQHKWSHRLGSQIDLPSDFARTKMESRASNDSNIQSKSLVRLAFSRKPSQGLQRVVDDSGGI